MDFVQILSCRNGATDEKGNDSVIGQYESVDHFLPEGQVGGSRVSNIDQIFNKTDSKRHHGADKFMAEEFSQNDGQFSFQNLQNLERSESQVVGGQDS